MFALSALRRNVKSLAALLALVALLSLSACASTPSPTPTPPSTPSQSARAIYTLIDRSSSYQRFTKAALDRYAEVLPLVVGPGDRLIAAWIGSRSGDPAETFLNDRVSQPPVPQSIISPGGKTTMEKEKERQDLEVFNRQQREMVEEFLARILPMLKGTSVTIDDNGTHIYEAVYQASRVFPSLSDGSQPMKRKLLILSDMQEYRSGVKDNVPLDLRAVDVVVAMFTCDGPAHCEQLREEWTRTFREAKASSVEFLVVDATTSDALARLLLR